MDSRDVSDARLAELEETIVDTTAAMSALTGKFLDALREFDIGEGWGAQGARSCVQWLSWRVGITVGTAREQVRVARALGDLPAIDAALHDGRLSYSKVRAMTRVATPENEEELLGLAELSTASQLERICRGYRRCVREIEGYEPRPKERHVNWRWEEGGLRVSGWFPAEEGELIRQAMLAVQDSLRKEARARGEDDDDAEGASAETSGRLAEGASAETSGDLAEGASAETSGDLAEGASAETSATETSAPSAETSRTDAGDGSAEASGTETADTSAETSGTDAGGVSPETAAGAGGPEQLPDLADALAAMAESAIAHGARALPGGERTQVVLHLRPTGECCVDNGPPLDLAAALRLSCDAQLLPVRTDQAGRVLDVGRARRSVPPAIRRALRLRDRGCRFPGCTCSRFVDAHHVVHWAQGGETKLGNLVLLCRFHHQLVHDEGWTLDVTADGNFVFATPDGVPVAAVPPTPTAPPRPAPRPRSRPESGHYGRWDCAWAIQGLLEDDGLIA